MYDALSKFIVHPNFYRYLTVLILGTGLFSGTLYLLSGILFPFIAGLLGAYLFNPCVSFLHKYRIPRALGASIVVLSFIILLSLLVSIVLPALQKEISNFLSQIPSMLNALDSFIVRTTKRFDHLISSQDIVTFKKQFAHYIGDVMKWSANLMINIVGQGLVVANVLSIIIVTPLIMYYVLRDWPTFTKYTFKLIPPCYANTTKTVIQHIHIVLGAYLRGQGLICLILMMIYTTCLYIAGIPQSFLIGFLTGLLSFVPYLGGVTGICLSFVLLIPQVNTWHLMGRVVAIFVILTIFEGKILIPRLIGKRIGLHPVWMLFSLFAGAHACGFLGLVFAIPVAIIISSVIRFPSYCEKK